MKDTEKGKKVNRFEVNGKAKKNKYSVKVINISIKRIACLS